MYSYSISVLIQIINIKNATESIPGWDDSDTMMDIVGHCQEFIEAYKVDEESNKLAFGEFGRRMDEHYDWLKKHGAELD